jgi:MAP/microtubule affinity-regulating kinase
VWALGVLLFVSLTGIFPFKGETDQELFRKIGESDYPKMDFGLSRGASDLIVKMLKVDSGERITACEVLIIF